MQMASEGWFRSESSTKPSTTGQFRQCSGPVLRLFSARSITRRTSPDLATQLVRFEVTQRYRMFRRSRGDERMPHGYGDGGEKWARFSQRRSCRLCSFSFGRRIAVIARAVGWTSVGATRGREVGVPSSAVADEVTQVLDCNAFDRCVCRIHAEGAILDNESGKQVRRTSANTWSSTPGKIHPW